MARGITLVEAAGAVVVVEVVGREWALIWVVASGDRGVEVDWMCGGEGVVLELGGGERALEGERSKLAERGVGMGGASSLPF